ASVDYFTLNGRSFPYTFRESLITGSQEERIKLRVVNGGSKGISLHTHGHKFTVTHKDGVALPANSRAPEDTVWLSTAQRIDVSLELVNDGVHAYGPGIWPFHDHQNSGVTTDGIGPGGNISAIVYDEYLQADGWPETRGVSWNQYFTEEYYRKEVPVWESYAPGLFAHPGRDWLLLFRASVFWFSVGFMIVLGLSVIIRR
ncbi:MAG: multicopper oxidase domain-containing protein, partial [Gammaproteobacteria bacterium]